MALLGTSPPSHPSACPPETGGPIDGEYDDGDLTGMGVRVYIVDTGVQGSHHDFGGRVVSGHTVREGRTSRCFCMRTPTARTPRPLPGPPTPPHQLYSAPSTHTPRPSTPHTS